jgi:hypothetical protein
LYYIVKCGKESRGKYKIINQNIIVKKQDFLKIYYLLKIVSMILENGLHGLKKINTREIIILKGTVPFRHK